MMFNHSLLALALAAITTVAGAPATANICPKPVITAPTAGNAVGPITIKGTTSYPCGLVYLYVNNQVVGVVDGSGDQTVGAKQTFEWKDNLELKGKLVIKAEATSPDPAYNWQSTFSKSVTVNVA